MYLLPRRIGMMSISSVMILFFGDRANVQSSDSVVAMQISLWAYSVSLHHSTISESHRLFEKRASRIVCSIVYATRHLKISSSHLHLLPPAPLSPLSLSLFLPLCYPLQHGSRGVYCPSLPQLLQSSSAAHLRHVVAFPLLLRLFAPLAGPRLGQSQSARTGNSAYGMAWHGVAGMAWYGMAYHEYTRRITDELMSNLWIPIHRYP